MAKLEKADILELTVRHLQTLRRQNQLTTRGEQTYAERFKAGFRHCAAEVTHFLGVMDQDTSIHVLKHLNGCINRLETATNGSQTPTPAINQQRSQTAEPAHPIQPAPVNNGPRTVPSVPSAVWMQKNGRPLVIQPQPQQPQNYQNLPGAAAAMHQRTHSNVAAAAAAAAYYANRPQYRQTPPHDVNNMHMIESSTRINTPPMSPNIEVDDMPVWRPW